MKPYRLFYCPLAPVAEAVEFKALACKASSGRRLRRRRWRRERAIKSLIRLRRVVLLRSNIRYAHFGIWDFSTDINIKINQPYFHLEILHRKKDRILFRVEKFLRRRRIFSCFASVFREIHEAKREPPRPERRQ